MILTDAQIDSGALARRLLLPANNLVPVNLLTRQQASLEDAGTAGWQSSSATLTRSTAQAVNGSASMLVTLTSTGSAIGAYTDNVQNVVAGRTYTAVARYRLNSGSRLGFVRIQWLNAAGGSLGLSDSSYPVLSASAWTEVRVTGIAPAGAVMAQVFAVAGNGGNVGDSYYLDAIGLWEGAGGSWVNGGERLDPSTLGWYWDESVGRRLFVWDTINNRWQMVYGDTGWRDVSTWLASGWAFTASGSIKVRRVGSHINMQASQLNRNGAITTAINVPSGWRTSGRVAIPGVQSAAAMVLLSLGGGEFYCDFSPTDASFSGGWSSADPWPTSLPGTASGSIPNL